MYQISELAEKCGVNKETIRYYERVGLLKEPLRTKIRDLKGLNKCSLI